MQTGTVPFDPAEFLDSHEAQVEYLRLSMQENDPAEIAQALGVVARARGMSAMARETGLGRESLYKSLSEEGNPGLVTLTKVLQALGMKLTVVSA